MRRGILAGRSELEALSDRLSQSAFEPIYETLHQRCDLILEAAPIAERQWRTFWIQGRRGAAVQAARTTQGRIIDLLIAHHIDTNLAYRDRAIEELKNITHWTTWTDPSNQSLDVDLCTAEAALAAVVGLDWLWEDLQEADRLSIIDAIRLKAIKPYLAGVANKAWWYDCYHHWNAVINAGLGLAGLALDDEEQGSETFSLACKGLGHFYDVLGKEGGWDEGTGHWGYAMRYLLLFAEATHRANDDEKFFTRRGMDHTGLFPVYFTPNGRPAGFGTSAVPLYGSLYLLPKHHDLPELTWWLDTYSFHRDVTTSGFSAAGLAMLFRPPDAPAVPEVDLEPVKVFSEIGWAAMADSWPRPSMYAAIKTGDLSAHNSRRDMNSLQIQVNSEMLVAQQPAGPDGTLPESDEFYDVHARAYNTIVVAERDHQLDALGTIAETSCGKNHRWVCCDANIACGASVQFFRHVVMVVDADGAGRAIVVVDEISNPIAERVDLFWHGRGKITLDPAQPKGLIRGRRGDLHFAIGGTQPMRTWTEDHTFGPRHTDHVIWTTTQIEGTGLLVSCFAGESITNMPTIKTAQDGSVCVEVDSAKLSFTAGPEHLTLADVSI